MTLWLAVACFFILGFLFLVALSLFKEANNPAMKEYQKIKRQRHYLAAKHHGFNGTNASFPGNGYRSGLMSDDEYYEKDHKLRARMREIESGYKVKPPKVKDSEKLNQEFLNRKKPWDD